ncbi:MAG: hypothetical protein GY727_13600 [Gammaproteobacteria bacterium]|nr:hypothetical protein [Gammaproteobacteria bacterium]MCP4088321.1 hypothetical protein [Gammaproteobacteria bacterium]MCP4276368.1 hypothetical protein [Gammaproteobacteria bacterium]MCP4831015.1 hypothetical protein [Gammaproteobacteria bacterium]MCP4927464.1 hypothetical protein [Gammaproteobacteria bacterium]
MRIWFLLLYLVALPGVAMADASNGEFMGYQLGGDYKRTSVTDVQTATNGNLIISAENPVKPENITDVSLIATAETLTIGYINAASWFDTEAEAREFGKHYVELLRAKYPTWEFGRELLDAQMHIIEVNFDRPPFNLQTRINQAMHNGESKWRLSMTLGWLYGSKEARAWRNMSLTQQLMAQEDSRKKKLENSDARGL